ncbi:MAG TPA: hypothetical protein VFE30_01305 [Anaeromyxobacteraceae bacterium]|nr:hypothetical protein [Anaeromyxobacteraceae bacterium]
MTIARRALAAVLLLLGACSGSQHLWDARGRAYQAGFAVQHSAPPPGGKGAEAVVGLDSQEAAIIAASYRHSLAPKQGNVNEQSVLFVAPPQQGQPGYSTPPPSVPKE